MRRLREVMRPLSIQVQQFTRGFCSYQLTTCALLLISEFLAIYLGAKELKVEHSTSWDADEQLGVAGLLSEMTRLRVIGLVGAVIIAALIVSCSFNQFVSATASPGLSAATSSLESPWVQKAHQYKGQLHCHTTYSIGEGCTMTPVRLLQAYKSQGFNFVVITDWNRVTKATTPGILSIGGAEQSGIVPGTTSNTMHYTPIGATTAYPTNYAQDGINAEQRAGVSVFTISHPWWNLYTNHMQTAYMISRVHGLTSMDIYDAAMSYASPTGTTSNTAIWDDYLTHYGRLWGTAVDDYHYGAIGKGYVVINANSLSTSDVLAALKSGNFYSVAGSNGAGPGIKSITVANGKISVVTTNAATIKWYVTGGRLARQHNTGSDSYTPTGSDRYVRIEAVSATGTAWSQPIYVSQKPLPASTTTIATSNTTPAVGQSVTFTAILKSSTTPLSGKSVTIYHYLNGVKYTDTTKTTNTAGQIAIIQKFSSTGKRTYYATFAGGSTYAASTSPAITVTVL